MVFIARTVEERRAHGVRLSFGNRQRIVTSKGVKTNAEHSCRSRRISSIALTLRVIRPRSWKPQHRPHATAVRTVRDRHNATVQLHRFAHKAEPQTRTLAASRGVLERVEALENPRERVLGNPRAFVLNGDFHRMRWI